MQHAGQSILLGTALTFVGASALVVNHKSTPFDAEFESVGRHRMVDSDLLRAIAKVESNMNPRATSPKNTNGTFDYGLMQINEATARGYGVNASKLIGQPHASIDLAARILLDMRRQLGDRYTVTALISSYNQGAAGFLARGPVNSVYVAAVTYHHQLYSIGRIFRGSV